ncbi:hypothetical protein B0T22DRAFT_293156 [Podospora appendiculata]|uniref:Uncharacterized protein n=1 Tax=Podospora appendiculata TaxID=314037 RepID=A0AAE1C8E7_9PEZI|nr:hypothetical protein B0T22DRAFT_293156 [Podospora appendiculata]
MGSISREHVIKRAYYNQLLLDIKHSGIGAYLTIPEALYADESLDEYCLPVLARTSVSHRPAMDPRPFSKRTTDTFVAKGYYLWPGTILTAEKAARSRLRPSKNPDENPACTSIIGNRGCDEPRTAVDDPEAPSSKRKRTVPGQGPRPAPALSNTVNANTGPSEPPAKTFNTHFFQREDWFAVCDDKMTQFSNTKRLMGDNWPAMLANTRHIDLVDRTGSAAAQQPGANRRPIADSTMAGQGTQIYPQPPVFASALVGAGETSTSFLAELMPDTTTDSSGEHILMDGHLDVQVQDLNSILPGMEQWDMTEQATLYMPGFDGPADGTDHWMLLAEGVGVGSAGASWDEGGGGGGDRGGSG